MGPLRRERCSLVGRLRLPVPPKRAATQQPTQQPESPMRLHRQRKAGTPPAAAVTLPRISTADARVQAPASAGCTAGRAAAVPHAAPQQLPLVQSSV